MWETRKSLRPTSAGVRRGSSSSTAGRKGCRRRLPGGLGRRGDAWPNMARTPWSEVHRGEAFRVGRARPAASGEAGRQGVEGDGVVGLLAALASDEGLHEQV